MEFLEINNINKLFGGLHAVNDVSFKVKKGLIKAVIGPNGAGKTTLFNLISGSIKLSSGNIYFDDKPISGLKPYQIANRGISRTFQNIRLFSHLSVFENVMIGRHRKTRAGFFPAILNLPWTWKEEQKIKEKSLGLLNLFSIENLKDEDVLSLPFGKQRLVELSRALASEPELLLLDEPASGLNIHETEELAEQIIKIKAMGITVLLVEHDMSLVMDISDDIVVLNYGKKIAEGTPKKIQKNKKVVSIYLGE